jgi:hypothetical protein
MGRSYFSRITSRGRATALVPPRPIATLWKAARFARLTGGELGMSQRDTEHDVLAHRASVSVSRAKTFVTGSFEREDSSSVASRFDPGITSRSMQRAEPLSHAQATPEKSDFAQQDPPRNKHGRSPGPIQIEDHPRTGKPNDADATAVVPQAPPRLQSTVIPGEPHERSIRATPAPQSEPAASAYKNSLHIGRIDVQIVPPRAAVPRAAAPKSRSRLARGYTLWTNW